MFVGRKFFFPREEKITPLSDFYGYLGYPGYLLCLYLDSPPLGLWLPELPRLPPVFVFAK